MFVRKKKNRSGTVSVVVVDKSHNMTKELVTIGVSNDPKTIEKFCQQGKEWIQAHTGICDIFNDFENKNEEKQAVDYFLANVENVLLNGAQLILDNVFQNIGFNVIKDGILKQLVIARLCQPASKAGTVKYLKSYFDEDVYLHNIYRYLDKLYNTQQDTIQEISVAHTRKVLGCKIGVVFYDVTTLYFETDNEDFLRKKGWSKDGKQALPQVVWGLLVSDGGYPLAYSIHEGNKYEGHTMLPVVQNFVEKFSLTDFVVVADSGLMSQKNVAELEKNGYKYIVGARIKNEDSVVKKWILAQEKQDGMFYEYQKNGGQKLILGYSENRAKKDAHNREKGIKRLEKDYSSGRITKEKINKRGYNKFLQLSDNVEVTINYDKIGEEAAWDGLKGYITNTRLPAQQVYAQYSELWQVERAFRVTKGVLELRPMFHFTPKRIAAHVCICFVAYKVYKELERILRLNRVNLTVDRVLNIAKTIVTLKIKLPKSGGHLTQTMIITSRHKQIEFLFNKNFWESARG